MVSLVVCLLIFLLAEIIEVLNLKLCKMLTILYSSVSLFYFTKSFNNSFIILYKVYIILTHERQV